MGAGSAALFLGLCLWLGRAPFAAAQEGIPAAVVAGPPGFTPSSTLTTEEYYRSRNWAWPTATATPWPRILPCETGGSRTLEDWIRHWFMWIELYRDRGWHTLPAEILLSIVMQESRGDPDARGMDGEIGIFQVLPSSVHATVSELEQSSKNVYHGIGLLEQYTWEAYSVVRRVDMPYRPVRY
ncbi:MAG: transglycosylase SLT domain-containing protein, partial [Anaerolineales bacterium]